MGASPAGLDGRVLELAQPGRGLARSQHLAAGVGLGDAFDDRGGTRGDARQVRQHVHGGALAGEQGAGWAPCLDEHVSLVDLLSILHLEIDLDVVGLQDLHGAGSARGDEPLLGHDLGDALGSLGDDRARGDILPDPVLGQPRIHRRCCHGRRHEAPRHSRSGPPR